MKKLIIFFIALCVILSNVNATRYVNHRFYEGVIKEDGSFLKTNVPLTNSKAIGFTCLDQGCKNLGNLIFNPNVLNSGNSANLILSYTTELQSQYGYGVYYFKENYIPWEANPNWHGTDSSDPQGPFDIYLAKKEKCVSFISNLTVVNIARPFLPLQILFEAGVGATVFSGIDMNGPLEAIPREIENHYKARQSIRIDIFDDLGNLISGQSMEALLKFGDKKNFEFTFTPTKTGKHKIVVTSDVNDAKCLSSPEISAIKEVSVFEKELPKNLCYNLINDVSINTFKAEAGDTIVISGKKISNKVT